MIIIGVRIKFQRFENYNSLRTAIRNLWDKEKEIEKKRGNKKLKKKKAFQLVLHFDWKEDIYSLV